MKRRLAMAIFAIMIATPIAAQVPAGMMMRVDRSTNAADPDDVPEVTVAQVPNGFQVGTGPAAVIWNANDNASGEYTLSATLTLTEPSSHNNYYGLVYGANGMAGDGQTYLYFLIGQNGSYIVKQRVGNETVNDIQGRTPHDAINTPDSSGRSVNELEVRVGANETAYVVNGTVVFTAPRSGMTAQSDGLYGVRVNHVIPGVIVENLRVR